MQRDRSGRNDKTMISTRSGNKCPYNRLINKNYRRKCKMLGDRRNKNKPTTVPG